ncbi:MAG: hypothetical protein ACI8RH_001787, partial [Flavobacteriales bacterium]
TEAQPHDYSMFYIDTPRRLLYFVELALKIKAS